MDEIPAIVVCEDGHLHIMPFRLLAEMEEKKHEESSFFQTLNDSPIQTVPVSRDVNDYVHRIDTKTLSNDVSCLICLEELKNDTNVVVQPVVCTHVFHLDCLSKWFPTNPRCPSCRTCMIEVRGTQPLSGEFHKTVDTAPICGYPEQLTIVMQFLFPPGIQGREHPHPEEEYVGCFVEAFLPWNKEGQDLLRMFEQAWKQRLLFRIDVDQVIPNGDHMFKTRRTGGFRRYGYPDETYLLRTKKVFEEIGIPIPK